MNHEKLYNDLVSKIESMVDEDFDYEVEHWENGNFDDSFEYGLETGEQYTAKDLIKFIKNQ